VKNRTPMFAPVIAPPAPLRQGPHLTLGYSEEPRRNADNDGHGSREIRSPEDISHAFGEALILLIQWRGGADEPAVTLDGERVSIGFVFDLVISREYSAQMPRSMSELLQTHLPVGRTSHWR
jgi:hypothetical protein